MAFTTQRTSAGRTEVYYTSDRFDRIFRLKDELDIEVQLELDSLKEELVNIQKAKRALEQKRTARLKELGPDFSPFEDDSVLEEIDEEDYDLTLQEYALDNAIYTLEDYLD